MRRLACLRSPLLPAVLLAGALACGGSGEGETALPDAPDAEVWKPSESPGPAASGEAGAAAPDAPAPDAPAPDAPAPDVPAADAARAEVERLEARVHRAEQELADARAELAAAREALTEAERGPARSDAAIFREVQRRLLEAPALRRVAIRAEVDDAVVTLHGRVPDRQTAREAGALAARVQGVVRVESRIRVSEAETGDEG